MCGAFTEPPSILFDKESILLRLGKIGVNSAHIDFDKFILIWKHWAESCPSLARLCFATSMTWHFSWTFSEVYSSKLALLRGPRRVPVSSKNFVSKKFLTSTNSFSLRFLPRLALIRSFWALLYAFLALILASSSRVRSPSISSTILWFLTW